MPLPARMPAPKARWFLLGVVVGALAGCSGRTRYTPPTGPMPPNTVLLSQMMQELSATPGFTEAVLREIDKGSKNGPALLTPKLADTLRAMILGKDWGGLNRFPGWTMREINPTVRVAGHFIGPAAGNDTEAENLANPAGCPTLSQFHRERVGYGAAQIHEGVASAPANCLAAPIATWIDLGPYPLDHPATVDLNQPSNLPTFDQDAKQQGTAAQLGDGVTRGDGPDPAIAPMHPESARLALLLNRLSLNALEGVPQPANQLVATIGGQRATTPEQLLHILTTQNHTITVADARYFANFGHFHYNGHDVMMPFWVNSEILVPGANRPLLVPVSHAEYEWYVRGPKINADVAFYFGIGGKAEFRTMDELNQPWVLSRHAHTYTGPKALEVTRLTSAFVITYIHAHKARPNLPFGGYYALGVCQDAIAAIENKLTGHATLFPNTADITLFNDPRDAEINQLIAAIPKDRNGARPTPERIFGSLPTEDLHAITIPGLASDLIAAKAAWQAGTLQHTHDRRYWIARSLEALGVALAAFVVYRLRRPTPHRSRFRNASST